MGLKGNKIRSQGEDERKAADDWLIPPLAKSDLTDQGGRGHTQGSRSAELEGILPGFVFLGIKSSVPCIGTSC